MSIIKFLFIPILYCLMVTDNWALTSRFTIYAYLPWSKPEFDTSSKMLKYGIQPIQIIYENKFLTNDEIDYEKLKILALETVKKAHIPISFDMEFGDRFKPRTVLPKIETILKYFRKYNTKSPIGLYAIIPQNTYEKITDEVTYERLDKPYRHLINWVDFISPSLYNYQKNDFNAWLKNAEFTMQKAKNDSTGKPILPYISPIIRLGPFPGVKKGNLIIELTEKEMAKRLETLQRLGASGCIIWASSQDRDSDGNVPEFNPKIGWGKAVITFINSHK